jgi:hypothetical protein
MKTAASSYEGVPVRMREREPGFGHADGCSGQRVTRAYADYYAVVFLENGKAPPDEKAEVYHIDEAAARRISNLENDLAKSQVRI